MITRKDVLNNFTYDKELGGLLWSVDRGSNKVKGINAGTVHTDNRKGKGERKEIRIKFNNVTYPVHRLVWLYIHGEWPDEIDHLDGDTLNNKLENLRSCTRLDNQKNIKVRKDTKTGINGVGVQKSTGRYQVRIVIDYDGGRRRKFLGYFDQIWDAICVRKSADNKYNYHLNHGRRC